MNKKIIVFLFFIAFSSSLSARGTASAILVYPHFGLGMMSLGGSNDINEKIESIAEFTEGAKKLSWMRSMGATVGYRFNHRYTIGLMFDYMTSSRFFSEASEQPFSISHPKPTPGTHNARYYEFVGGIKATALGANFFYNIYSSGKLSFDVGTGILFAPSIKYYEDTTFSAIGEQDEQGLGANLEQIEGTAKGFGFLFGVSTSYYFTNYLGLGLDLSYKYLRSGALKDADGNDLVFIFPDGTADDSLPMRANFSGLYFGASLKIEFNIGSATRTTRARDRRREETIDDDFFFPELEGWDDTYTDSYGHDGPSIDELRDLKRQVQRKWNNVRADRAPEAQRRADRYRRLYDVVNKLERDWDHFSPMSRSDKVEKIRTILSY